MNQPPSINPKSVPDSTLQSIFDIVSAHMRKQAHQCKRTVGGNGSYCAYRGEGGTACAIGCLIPDEYYDARMEGADIRKAVAVNEDPHVHDEPDLMQSTAFMDTLDQLFGEGWEYTKIFSLLDQLQFIHDSSSTVDNWDVKLNLLAKSFNLDVTKQQPQTLDASKRVGPARRNPANGQLST